MFKYRYTRVLWRLEFVGKCVCYTFVRVFRPLVEK